MRTQAKGLPICVIGAGPAGAAAALALAARGFSRVTLLERCAWPRDKTCGGALSLLALDWLARARLLDEVAKWSTPISRYRLTLPPHGAVHRVTDKPICRIVRRAELDAFMVAEACRAGATLVPESPVTAIRIAAGGVEITTAKGELEAAAVIVATGALDSVKGAQLPPRQSVATVMAHYADLDLARDEIEMHYLAPLVPYYLWLFPEPNGDANVGITRPPSMTASLHALFDDALAGEIAPRFARATRTSRRCGAPIAFSERVGQVVNGPVLIAGEAAGLVNSATGEGIYYALASGALAGRMLAEALLGDGDASAGLATYQTQVERSFGPMLAGAARLRQSLAAADLREVTDPLSLPYFRALAAQGHAARA